jgi:beta-galactosidase
VDPHPEVAIAYSFASNVASNTNRPQSATLGYFSPAYEQQVQGAFEPLFRDNIDTAIVDIGHANLSRYKLVVVPADYVTDPASAKAVRDLDPSWTQVFFAEQNRRYGATSL